MGRHFLDCRQCVFGLCSHFPFFYAACDSSGDSQNRANSLNLWHDISPKMVIRVGAVPPCRIWQHHSCEHPPDGKAAKSEIGEK